MTLQVVPFMTQGDLLDPDTYKELGFKGAMFAISLLILVFCIAKGHIKIVGCGPNEGGIREFFGITLWKVGPGPHLHIAGILPVRKVSFASKQIDLIGAVKQRVGDKLTVDYAVDINIEVRKDKVSIEQRVYGAEDTNRADAENDEAVRQAASLAARFLREVIEEGAEAFEIENSLEEKWSDAEADELSGESERSTYGYRIKSVDVKKFVERELSEISRAIQNSPLTPSAPTGIASILDRSA